MLFFFNDTATTEIYTLSLHDALPIWRTGDRRIKLDRLQQGWRGGAHRQRYRGIAREGFPGRVEEQGPAERGYRSGAAEYDDLPSREYCAPSGAHHRFRPIN